MSTLVPATNRQQNKGVGSKSRQYYDPETCQFASESMQGQRDMPLLVKHINHVITVTLADQSA
jgi:hypothetical protein